MASTSPTWKSGPRSARVGSASLFLDVFDHLSQPRDADEPARPRRARQWLAISRTSAALICSKQLVRTAPAAWSRSARGTQPTFRGDRDASLRSMGRQCARAIVGHSCRRGPPAPHSRPPPRWRNSGRPLMQGCPPPGIISAPGALAPRHWASGAACSSSGTADDPRPAAGEAAVHLAPPPQHKAAVRRSSARCRGRGKCHGGPTRPWIGGDGALRELIAAQSSPSPRNRTLSGRSTVTGEWGAPGSRSSARSNPRRSTRARE